MRFAWVLPAVAPAEQVAEAVAAEALGYDAVWLEPGPLEPLAAAAHLATATVGARVGVSAEVGSDHPLELAERASVADLVLGGRLVLGVRPAAGTDDRFAEALDLLLECFASHPFRHGGPTWPTPAGLEQHRFNLEQRVRMTPPPAQFELPVWVEGPVGRADAVARALGVVADADEDHDGVARWWAGVRADHPAMSRRMRRAARWRPPLDDGRVDVEAAIEGLRVRQRDVELDMTVVDCARAVGDCRAIMDDIARHVRPRVQLDRYPPGLEAHWIEGVERVDQGGAHA